MTELFPLARRSAAGALLIALAVAMSATPAQARQEAAPARSSSAAAVLTLDEAIQIALVQNRALESARLEVDRATAQVREGWGELMPQIDLTSRYTRNVRTVNPFAGSEAGGFFNTLGFIDWLAFNEQARTDGDPGSEPISVQEFFARQQAGRDAAGIAPVELGDNPFAVPNVYRSGLSVTQKIFDGRAIVGAVGASKYLGPLNQNAKDRQEQLLIEQVKQAWYGTLLAMEQERVVNQSVRRAEATMNEIARQVSEGVTPKFQRLSAEVELANLQTQHVQTANAAREALDDLKLLIGVPVDQEVSLRGDLRNRMDADLLAVSTEEAAAVALKSRPDLEQSRLNIELQDIQLQVAKAEYLPNIDAFANLGYVGNVPDNRQAVFSDPNDPFSFSTTQRGYFDDAYWDWDFNVGFSMTWNLFNGLSSTRRVQQRKINVQQARLDHEQLLENVRAEVERALRNVRAAHTRMVNQEQNVDRARLNYSYARTRLEEGVATPLEVREASDQLDQTSLNYLQAVHDYLVARAAYEAATGTTYTTADGSSITSN